MRHPSKRCYMAAILSVLGFCFVGGLYNQVRKLSNDLTHLHPGITDAPISSSLRLQTSILNAPIGSLGPKATPRHHLLYYDFLFLASLRYAGNAKSLLEVGCASDPFAQHLTWLEQRSCLAPYYASYSGGHESDTTTGQEIAQIKADFMEWTNPHGKKYDLVICNQVLEHVPDPKAFLQKLIQTSQQTTIVSVPYKWAACGEKCGHLHHEIDLNKVLEWAHPYQPVHHSVITEDSKNGMQFRRIFAVFQR